MYLNNIDVVDNAVDLGIPVFAYFTNLNLTTGTGCSFCIAAHNKIFNTDTFKNWVASRSYYFMMIPMHGIGYGPLIDRIHKLCNGYNATNFPFGLYYWKNKDTGEVKYHVFDRFNDDPLGNTDVKLIATIDKAFDGWDGLTTEVKVIKPFLTTFG